MDLKTLVSHLYLIDSGQTVELQPRVADISSNRFEYDDYSDTHLRIRHIETGRKYPIPFAMIEFITPRNEHHAIIGLKRQMTVQGGILV